LDEVFFFSPFGDHPEGDLATFGYRPAMKVENLLKSFYILATCLEPKGVVETWRVFRIRKKKIIWAICF